MVLPEYSLVIEQTVQYVLLKCHRAIDLVHKTVTNVIITSQAMLYSECCGDGYGIYLCTGTCGVEGGLVYAHSSTSARPPNLGLPSLFMPDRTLH
jgi:hypothetical protein